MLYTIITNPWVMMIVCSALVFCEMFVAKKWFISFTEKIKNEKVRRGANIFLGVCTCMVLAVAQMYALCDMFEMEVYYTLAFAAALIASFIYLVIEKIFTESEVNALGKAFCDFVSHSDLFDGELSNEGVVAVARKLLNITNEIDKKAATKQEAAVEEVVKKLNEFLNDGKITDEERKEAEEMTKGMNLDGNSTYEKYKALLNK